MRPPGVRSQTECILPTDLLEGTHPEETAVIGETEVRGRLSGPPPATFRRAPAATALLYDSGGRGHRAPSNEGRPPRSPYRRKRPSAKRWPRDRMCRCGLEPPGRVTPPQPPMQGPWCGNRAFV